MTNLIKVGAIVLAGALAAPSMAYAQMDQPMSGNDSMQKSDTGAMPMKGKSSSSMMKKKSMMKDKKMMMQKNGMQ